jgi:xanthine dehydrogenase iron-sulfur cluster and FAD-binding subunit A
VLSGHLCRCTGYIGIKEAMRELTTLVETDHSDD